jgi:hypothetical protein
MPIRTTFAIIIAMLSHGRELNLTGTENLLWNGEKAYYQGGGWWRFHFYTNRGKSVVNTAIESLTSSGKPCEDCGTLTISKFCRECINYRYDRLAAVLRGRDGYI